MDLIGFVMWIILVCSFIILNNNGVEANTLSTYDDSEIAKKLKRINKPAVKIIETIYGDAYGCVDFYKQPAFDPSLNNHTFHYKMRPSTSYPIDHFGESKARKKTFGFMWKNGVGCPERTVPIQRVTKDQLIRITSHTNKYSSSGSPNSSNEAHHFAWTRTKGTDRRFSGASMDASLYNLTVQKSQFSACRMHIQIGNDDYIQVGWTANPFLYPDSQTRLYVYTQAGGKRCYNSLCGVGIISVRPDIPFGQVFQPVSVRGRSIHFEDFAVFKDKVTGNWWLQMYGGEQIGFWPANRFRETEATAVEWGGEVFSESLPSPPMGNGFFPEGNTKLDAFVSHISVVDAATFQTDNRVDNTETYSDNDSGYKVKEITVSPNAQDGHVIVFGGPGNI